MLRASDARRWVSCPASGAPVEERPERPASTPLQREAVEAREAADALLYGDEPDPSLSREIGQIAERYAEGVRWSSPVRSRREVAPWSPFAPLVDGAGRLDIGEADGALVVYGLSVSWNPVEIEGDARFALAAAINWDEDRHDGVLCVINQPRPYHPAGPWREWYLRREDLLQWRQWLFDRAVHAMSGTLQAQINPYCKRCDRASTCVPLARAGREAVRAVEDAGSGRPPTPEEIGRELTFLVGAREAIDARYNALLAEGEVRATKDGAFIPGWHVRTKHSRPDWNYSPTLVALATGRRVMKLVPKTPAELRKEGVPDETIRRLSSAKFAGHELAPVKASSISRSFKQRKAGK